MLSTLMILNNAMSCELVELMTAGHPLIKVNLCDMG